MKLIVYKETQDRHYGKTIVLIACLEKDLPAALSKIDATDARIYKVDDDDCFDTERLLATIEYKTIHGDYLSIGTTAH